jgi:hypothetical protein
VVLPNKYATNTQKLNKDHTKMKTFKQYLKEAFLLENKAWHQFVGQNAKKLLDRAGLSTTYMNIGNEPGHGTPEHVTNYLSRELGMEDLNTDEGRWVLKNLHGGGIQRAEDVQSTVIPNLKRLRQARTEGKSDASLARIQGASALHAHLAKVYPASQESLEHLKPEEYTVHGENEHWTVVQPKTKEAACAVGKGTSWCTASAGAHNMFGHYSGQAPLYSLIPKNPVRKGERYQMHLPTDPHEVQYMDEHDQPVHLHQKWSPLSDSQRPLPEIKDPHARGTIHGMRDLHDFILADEPISQTEMLTPRLAKGSKPDSPEDTVNAAMIQHFRAYHPRTGASDHTLGNLLNLRNGLTRNGTQTAKQAADHLDRLSGFQQQEVLDDATMEHLQTHPDWQKRLVGARKKWKPEHVMRAAKDPDPVIASNALPHFGNKLIKQLGPEHVDAVLEHPDFAVRSSVINWGLRDGRLTHDQINKLAADPDDIIRFKLTHPENVPHLSPAHVHTILQHSNKIVDPDRFYRDETMLHRLDSFHPRNFDDNNRRANRGDPPLNSKPFISIITPEHITAALQNPDKYHANVRQRLIEHPAFDPSKHMDLARQNKDLFLQKGRRFPYGDPITMS